MRNWLIAALSLTLLLPGQAIAQPGDGQCEIQAIEIRPEIVRLTYSPFDPVETEEEFRLDLQVSDCSNNRAYVIGIGADDPRYLQGRTINLIGPGDRQLNGRILGRGGTEPSGNNGFALRPGISPLFVVIPRGQVVVPGAYQASLMAEPRAGNVDTRASGLVEPFEIIVNVEAAVGLSPAIGTELDLGELSDNDRPDRAVSFDAYANVDYELRLSSDNEFRLLGIVHDSQAIAYIPLLDSRPMSMSVPASDYSAPGGQHNRRRHQLTVTVPSIGDAPAGTYGDYITVAIRPRFGG